MFEQADLTEYCFRSYICYDERLYSTSYKPVDFVSDACRFNAEEYVVNRDRKLSLGEFPAYFMCQTDHIDQRTKNRLVDIIGKSSSGSIVSNKDVSSVLKQCMIQFTLRKCTTLTIDLRKSIDEIRSTYRKSFKSLINKGLRETCAKIYFGDQINKQLRVTLRALHLRAANKRTRSFGKWRSQFAQIENKNALLVCVYKGNSIINYSIFSIIGSVAYYQTGVNNPDICEQFGSHLSIHHAICMLKEYKVNSIILSQHIETHLSPKEASIVHFKKGLAREIRDYYQFDW